VNHSELKGWVLAMCGGWRGPRPGVKVLDLPHGRDLFAHLVAMFTHHTWQELNAVCVALRTLIDYADDIGDYADAGRLRQVRSVVEIALERKLRARPDVVSLEARIGDAWLFAFKRAFGAAEHIEGA